MNIYHTNVLLHIVKVNNKSFMLLMSTKYNAAKEIKALAMSQGMSTLRESAMKKAIDGDTSLEEVFRVTTDDDALDSEEPIEEK